ncbi:MAG: AraC family transcriptional regulator [Gammaproteobacteria bacterium]|nr:AraC family transcriptional regulator [Gammaproteobacteria bacterium]
MSTSDAGIFLWMTYQTMQRMGLDAAAIFAGVNLPDEPPDKTLRRDNSTQQRFWTTAEQISQDPYIGLHVGANMPVFRGQVIEYLFLSSSTFGDGLQRTLRYQSILTNAFKLDLHLENDIAVLTGFEHSVRHYLECGLGVFLKFFKHISDNEFQPTEIWLTHPEFENSIEYQHTWGCPVRFGMPMGCIRFSSKLLQNPSPAAQPELLQIHENLAEQHLHILSKHQLVHDIEKLLGHGLLESGQLDQQLIAEQLGINPRSLRADLQLINTTFEKIVANYREKLARRLLANTDESIDQIVYLTGFSEPSAFSRAFKRWTGETPTTYRQRKFNKNL